MTTINIFLVSSAEDLHEDSLEIRDFIRVLNDRYGGYDLQFNITVCEDTNIVPDMEIQYRNEQSICDSQLFVIVFYKNAEDYSIEMFDKAYKQFLDKNVPVILTFFRTDGSEPTKGVKKFMNRLDLELGHYFKTYSDIDAMKLYLLMQLLNMEKDGNIEFHDGQAYVAGEAILSLEHLPELKNNFDWQCLYEDYEKFTKDFTDIKEKLKSNPDDPVLKNKYAKIDEKLDNVKKQLADQEEKLIWFIRQSLDNGSKGELTDNQRKAYHFMEQGDFEDAIKILDPDAILWEISRAERRKEIDFLDIEKRNQDIKKYIQELLTVIDVKMLEIHDPTRFTEIENLYEIAVEKENKNHIEKVATRQYLNYLMKQCKYADGEKVARQYLETANKEGKLSDIADAENRLADFLKLQLNNEDSQEEAAFLFQDALKIRRQLASEDPEHFEKELASSCNSVANWLIMRNDADSQVEAEKFYREALEIAQRLAENDPSEYGEILAYERQNLASILGCGCIEDQEEAEHLFRDSLKFFYDHKQEKKESGEADLAHANLNFAYFLNRHVDTESQEDAEKLFRETINIYRKLSDENSYAYKKPLQICCSGLAFNLSQRANSEDQKEAESLFREALAISRELAKRSPQAFKKDVAAGCSQLARHLAFQGTPNNINEAKSLYYEAQRIISDLAEENPKFFEDDFAKCCSDFALFLSNLGNTKDSEEAKFLYREVLDIRRKQVKENPGVFEIKLVDSNSDLALVLSKWGNEKEKKEAELLFRDALKISQKLANDNPEDDYYSILARSYYNLACYLGDVVNFENDKVRQNEQGSLYRKAFVIRRKLVAKNPETYESEFVYSCFSLAKFLSDFGNREDNEEIESLYRESLPITRKLAAENSQIHKRNLAYNCSKLAWHLCHWYDETFLKEAESLYREAWSILHDLAKENPKLFERELASCCCHFAWLLSVRYSPKDPSEAELLFREAELLYREAIDIWRKWTKEDSEVFGRLLADTYTKLFLCLDRQIKWDVDGGLFGKYRKEQEFLLREAMSIWRELSSENPEAYENDLAICCDNLATFLVNFGNPGDKKEIEMLYREAVDIVRKLEGKDPEKFKLGLAYHCDQLAGFLWNQCNEEKQGEVISLYREALGIRHDLAKDDSEQFNFDLVQSCNNLANVLSKRDSKKDLKEAESLYRESLELIRGLSEQDYFSDVLALTCKSLADCLNKQDEENNQTEIDDLYRESLGIWRELVRNNDECQEKLDNNNRKGKSNFSPIIIFNELYYFYFIDSCIDFALVLCNRNKTMDMTENRKEAEALFREALTIARKQAEIKPAISGERFIHTCQCFMAFLFESNEDEKRKEAEMLDKEVTAFKEKHSLQ